MLIDNASHHWSVDTQPKTHRIMVLGPLHTRDWEPVSITLQALSLVENPELVQVRLRLRDQWSMWIEGGCQVYMDPYMASNGSCFMVTWTILRNNLLEVGLTHDRETIALRTLTTVVLFCSIMCKDPHCRPGQHMTSHQTWGSVTTLHDFGGVLGQHLDTFFWALTISSSRLLAHVWSGPQTNPIYHTFGDVVLP